MDSQSAKQVVNNGSELGEVVCTEPFIFIDPLRDVGRAALNLSMDSDSVSERDCGTKDTPDSDLA